MSCYMGLREWSENEVDRNRTFVIRKSASQKVVWEVEADVYIFQSSVSVDHRRRNFADSFQNIELMLVQLAIVQLVQTT